MKKLIAPVIVALLIVVVLALVTKLSVLPLVEEYANNKSVTLAEADNKYKALQLMHKTSPTGRFRSGDVSKEEITRSNEELEVLIAAGSMTFNNPEIQTLMEELKRRLNEVQKREARVEQVEMQLNIDWDNLEALTNQIDQARINLENRLKEVRTNIKTNEQANLIKYAAMLTNMIYDQSVDVAVVSLRQQASVAESAKLLYFMQPLEQAKLIGGLNKGEDEDKKLAHDILQEYKKIGREIPAETEN
jgi:hypothetical protein